MTMKALEYPFDAEFLLKKKKSIRKELLAGQTNWLDKKIAILGGSTTNDIRLMLELFLLNYGIRPEFYESEYNQYYQDAMFPNEELEAFHPDYIYIHTTQRNITEYPHLEDTPEQIEAMVHAQGQKFTDMWDRLDQVYHCPVIQTNFEMPDYRLLGNRETWDIHGKINFIQRLNLIWNQYAREHEQFYLLDIMYLSAAYGLDRWADPLYWYMYKYAVSVPAIPYLAFNLSNIIKSIYGKNKKAFVLDLDNTLWGGIVGDDGPENLMIGQEVPSGQVYTEFQNYLKEHTQLGVLLNVDSKNEEENAMAGLRHPDGTLKPEDFMVIRANWDPKDQNLLDIADELKLLPESMVFVDDNPAERQIVSAQIPGTAVPEVGQPESYIRILDRSGFFEVTELSKEDLTRTNMYKGNIKRQQLQKRFENYGEYLESLKMEAVIEPFIPVYMARIAQLTNKSNQFNLTTRRYTQTEIEEIAADQQYITLYGKLTDRFGDNGVVSVVIGKIQGETLEIQLWIMSCRVLKRGMEDAMMDGLIEQASQKGVKKLLGYYYPTAKNGMVREFYGQQGFEKVSEDPQGNTQWSYEIQEPYECKNKAIHILKETDRN